ncbi:GTP 3',8-cyclase MoaA [Pokkaliibacter sp. MBI-7]|uniref:GTP 3',8-cyclase MoaA n=1 Tax=Pokkaliibacter sp. MBI-7 TaxID=3040600 RepID=UPI00244C54AC|nr:GTP 3',8-cyclase MoaA [Pokkaliibacter sp. MBI-7]MDH2431789.1 GTP 3',8-cyclase MoaA [Pokkaliibacter sp. MBI-7]
MPPSSSSSPSPSPSPSPSHAAATQAATPALVDRFGRRVTYLRLSVTDRCDLRCIYCMNEDTTFLRRAQILSLEELALIARAFVALGVNRIRLTGGEPLLRPNVMWLVEQLGSLPGLQELTLTTNGAHLHRYARDLRRAGVKRLNISLDTLRPERFVEMARRDKLQQVLKGIECALAAGFERIKLNTVVLQGRNVDELSDLLDYAVQRGMDISFIEEMPLGAVVTRHLPHTYLGNDRLLQQLQQQYELHACSDSSGGPSRYYRMAGTRSRVGFISPHSDNFCASCNRVRLTVEGRLLLCLGNEHAVDLKAIVRRYPGDEQRLRQALIDAMNIKPERHHFSLSEQPQLLRFMNMTGG